MTLYILWYLAFGWATVGLLAYLADSAQRATLPWPAWGVMVLTWPWVLIAAVQLYVEVTLRTMRRVLGRSIRDTIRIEIVVRGALLLVRVCPEGWRPFYIGALALFIQDVYPAKESEAA